MRKRNKLSKFKENNSRYQFEMGSTEGTNKAQPNKSLNDETLATGSHLMGAFTSPLPVNEEYGQEETPDALARGEHLMGAFTNPLTAADTNVEFGNETKPGIPFGEVSDDSLLRDNHLEEYSNEFTHEIKSIKPTTKDRFQENLKQNYNVELSEELRLNQEENE